MGRVETKPVVPTTVTQPERLLETLTSTWPHAAPGPPSAASNAHSHRASFMTHIPFGRRVRRRADAPVRGRLSGVLGLPARKRAAVNASVDRKAGPDKSGRTAPHPGGLDQTYDGWKDRRPRGP